MCLDESNITKFDNYLKTHKKEINKDLKSGMFKEVKSELKEDRYAVQHYSQYAMKFPQADILNPPSYSKVEQNYLSDCRYLNQKDELYYQIINKIKQRKTNKRAQKVLDELSGNQNQRYSYYLELLKQLNIYKSLNSPKLTSKKISNDLQVSNSLIIKALNLQISCASYQYLIHKMHCLNNKLKSKMR